MTYRILRHYSIASLAVVVVAAVVVAALHRAIIIRGIEVIGENSNLAMARVALGPIRAQLADYLALAGGADGTSVALPPELEAAINDLMFDSHVLRVKIYNPRGIVTYSTRADQVGARQEDNPGFAEAMKGRVSVKLVYRDTLNPFDGQTEDDNLVQSYIPVRRRATEPVLGVFELYTDVNPLVRDAERFEIAALAATLLVLATVYLALLAVVGRAAEVIRKQAATIREKTAMLEALSRGSLRREERERKRIATDLHEGLAQTLSAVKLAIESAPPQGGAESLRPVVTDLRQAIDTVRTIATDLRPPSLDELGLLPTLGSLCRGFAQAHPGIEVVPRLAAAEALVPPALKNVVYRVVEAALRALGERGAVASVVVSLEPAGEALRLAIEVDSEAAAAALEPADAVAGEASAFAEIHERVVISGGRLRIDHEIGGFATLQAEWVLARRAWDLMPET